MVMQKTMRRTKGAIAALFALWLGMGAVSRVSADTAFTGEKWTDSIKFNGDMRIRHESFYIKSTAASGGQNSGHDRNRERLRLRFGFTANMQDFLVGFRIASGVGEQVSTNQTYQNDFNQKQLWIDQAYLTWKIHEYLKVTGGKMINPFWRTYASDVVWDDDVNPEGYAQQMDMPLGERASLFVNMAQLPLHEGGTTPDPWMFGNQIGSNLKVTEDTRLSLAGSFYGFVNEKAADFTAGGNGGAVRQYGNSRVGAAGTLATSLRLLHFTGELASHVGALPLAFDADFVHNIDARNSLDNDHNDGATGYQIGTILGKAKSAKSWEVAYFYKYVENNATFADIADSDFGYSGAAGGGGNRKGHILWLPYALRRNVTVKGKYFISRVLNPYLNSFGQPVSTPG